MGTLKKIRIWSITVNNADPRANPAPNNSIMLVLLLFVTLCQIMAPTDVCEATSKATFSASLTGKPRADSRRNRKSKICIEIN
jgi:hypothetical protein